MEPKLPSSERRQTIMIVDDVPDNIRVLANLLSDQCRIIAATSGETALGLASADDVDCILLDIMMPGMDGYEVCRRLKSDPSTQHIPVIFVTMLNDATDEEAGIRLGAVDYITRPFVPGIVRARVGTMLRLQNTANALRKAYDDLSVAYNTIEHDIQAAAQLQRSYLPPDHSAIAEIHYASLYRPSTGLSGDMFNYFRINERFQIFYGLDVSGHGAAAALMAAAVANVLKPEMFRHVLQVATNPSPEDMCMAIVQELNQRFTLDPEQARYFTIALGILDNDDHRLSLIQAGHPSPLLLKADGSAQSVGTAGVPVGLLSEPGYETVSLVLSDGDRLIVYSDGVTECENADGDAFGDDRLLDHFVQYRSQRLDTTLSALEASLIAWRGNDQFADDLSVLALECRPS